MSKRVESFWTESHSCHKKTMVGILINAEIINGVCCVVRRYFVFDIRFGGAHLDLRYKWMHY